MDDTDITPSKKPTRKSAQLHFDVSAGLKRVLGRELITDDEVAVFELVKNSFDAGAQTVRLYFDRERIIVADDGQGMSYDDVREKWLFVAYSAKRDPNAEKDFRQRIAERSHYAGSKGIGRFSSDRLGREVILQTKPKSPASGPVHRLLIDWSKFEESDQKHFDKVPVTYSEQRTFDLPSQLGDLAKTLQHGTVIEIRSLRERWPRARLQSLKASLAKLINPFGSDVDRFAISITAPEESEKDKEARAAAKKKGAEPLPRDIINGRVGNFVFANLRDRTTYIRVTIKDSAIETSLTDRGELIYRIREPNPYKHLENSEFRAEIYYLNTSAKMTFARRVGLPSIQFGSVFLFRNSFRVYPVGEDGDDWFGINRRKQQGYSRFLGTREIIGRIDVYGSTDEFEEASSRNQGLIDSPAVRELQKCVIDNCLKRLERYVVPVSWPDKAEKTTEDLSRLLTDPGKARVTSAVASLVDNDDVELLAFSKKLVDLINERSGDFQSSIVGLKAIAEKSKDKELLARVASAEKRFEDLQRSEAEARKIAESERAAAEAATQRADTAEAEAHDAKTEAEAQRRRAHFLQDVVNLDVATILNLHHQVTIYAVDVGQQIENVLTETADKKTVPRDMLLKALEQMAFLNRKILAITRFAARANFKLDSEKIETDLAGFVEEYIDGIANSSGSARMRVTVTNTHPGLPLRFNPIDVSIIVDNLVSNAKRARASLIKFEITQPERGALAINVSDNGRGIAAGTNRSRIFDMGYTTTRGSGLGLYHVRQVLGEMGGSIELAESNAGPGTSFLIRLVGGQSK